MTRRALSLLLGGAVALAVSGCSSDGSSNAGSSSTVATTTTIAAAESTAPSTSAAATTTVAAASSSTTATATTVAGATTTVAGRVVTKPDDNVKQGDSGQGVTEIQNALVTHGYKVVVDGKFGPQTAQAVINFQKANGLKQDGIVGPITWAKLQAAPTSTTAKAGATTTTTKSATTTTGA